MPPAESWTDGPGVAAVGTAFDGNLRFVQPRQIGEQLQIVLHKAAPAGSKDGRDAPARLDVVFGAGIADGAHDLLDAGEGLLGGRVAARRRAGPALGHQRLGLLRNAGQMTPDCLGNVGHEGVQQPQ